MPCQEKTRHQKFEKEDREKDSLVLNSEPVWFLLNAVAPDYGLTPRRLWDHVRGIVRGRILGFSCPDGNAMVNGDPRNFVGVLTNEWREYLKPRPKLITGIATTLASGCAVELSSTIWVVNNSGSRTVSLRSDVSGAQVAVKFC